MTLKAEAQQRVVYDHQLIAIRVLFAGMVPAFFSYLLFFLSVVILICLFSWLCNDSFAQKINISAVTSYIYRWQIFTRRIRLRNQFNVI